MFEVGFSEIVVIFALALVVLGPTKLPKLAATIGRWVGRARVMARQFRDQLEAESDTLRETRDTFRHEMNSIQGSLDAATRADETPPAATATSTPPTPGAASTAPAPTSAVAPSDDAPTPMAATQAFAPPTPNDNPVSDDTFSHAHPGSKGDEPGNRTPG